MMEKTRILHITVAGESAEEVKISSASNAASLYTKEDIICRQTTASAPTTPTQDNKLDIHSIFKKPFLKNIVAYFRKKTFYKKRSDLNSPFRGPFNFG